MNPRSLILFINLIFIYRLMNIALIHYGLEKENYAKIPIQGHAGYVYMCQQPNKHNKN